MKISNQSIQWLANGERGISSNTIFSHLTGINAMGSSNWGFCHPLDPSDFIRCEKLLKQAPELKEKFHRMREVSKEWAMLVDRWDEIVETLEQEIPGALDGKYGTAPKTYELIQQCINSEKNNEH